MLLTTCQLYLRLTTLNQMKHWFVFYTKSRHEKKVKDFLEKVGYVVFLPMRKVMRQWGDRKKKMEVPLFNILEHQVQR